MNTDTQPDQYPQTAPLDPPPVGSLPHALVFFLTSDQRRQVLGTLRTLNTSREAALLAALGVDAK